MAILDLNLKSNFQWDDSPIAAGESAWHARANQVRPTKCDKVVSNIFNFHPENWGRFPV